MPRTFIGWSLPDDLRDDIGRVVSRLREGLPNASWTRPDTYHMTFAFLGEQDEERLARIEEELTGALQSIVPARAEIGSAGVFPSASRPRVGWLGARPPEPIGRISDAVRQGLKTAGVTFDDKPFHPHVTLVRPKTRWTRRDVEQFVNAWGSLEGHLLLVDSVTLFESRLGSGGARHVSRLDVRLGD